MVGVGMVDTDDREVAIAGLPLHPEQVCWRDRKIPPPTVRPGFRRDGREGFGHRSPSPHIHQGHNLNDRCDRLSPSHQHPTAFLWIGGGSMGAEGIVLQR